jgi:hypothetical protein
MINLSYFYKQSLFVSTTNPTAGRINKQYLKKKKTEIGYLRCHHALPKVAKFLVERILQQY